MPTNLDNVLSWATDLDDKTLEQARRSASLPFIPGHVALMPDAHFGYGATVGSVIPTKGAIVPSAVGVDIGCGMIAARLDLIAGDLPDDLQKLHSMIARDVPAGVGQGHDVRDGSGDRGSDPFAAMPVLPVTQGESWWTGKLANKAANQFGSLGSGNHFVEVCLDEVDRVWIVLHSGSRGVGNQLANIHIDGAKGLMKQMFIDLPDPDLAYLVEGTSEFDAYIADMLWAQEYAMGNRQRMLGLVHACVSRFLAREVTMVDEINCHHNFTEREEHVVGSASQSVWLTRKGAIRARVGDRGVIPGSMGAQSFIVSGKGSAASYHSCSHGAGRRMSRNAARRDLDVATLEATMADKAWNGKGRSGSAKALIDEDPRAYKDIGEVMANQADLVTIEHTLRQILNYKGT
jgi:tRNA-splicing ligase RtcB (3'-phosphate/5'-hydroxy nucleic acid ligase)